MWTNKRGFSSDEEGRGGLNRIKKIFPLSFPPPCLSFYTRGIGKPKVKLPLKSSHMLPRVPLDNSWDERGVKRWRWLNLSSSRKWDEGDDLFFENRTIIKISSNRTPSIIPIMAAAPRPDLASFPDRPVWGLLFCPGGGGGAAPEDQEFPPVLQKNKKSKYQCIKEETG